jgi:hypothetical protein
MFKNSPKFGASAVSLPENFSGSDTILQTKETVGDLSPLPITHLIFLIPGALSLGSWTNAYTEKGMVGIKFMEVGHYRTPTPNDIVDVDVTQFANHVFDTIEYAVSQHKNAQISFIGHSFGTHVLAHLIENHLVQYSNNIYAIILWGSIANRKMVRQFAQSSKIFINDCGIRDLTVILVEALNQKTYSATGHFGFRNSLCTDRYFNFSHSDYTSWNHFESSLSDLFHNKNAFLKKSVEQVSGPRIPALTPTLLAWIPKFLLKLVMGFTHI